MIDERETILNQARETMARIQKLRIQAEDLTDRIIDKWDQTCSRPAFDLYHVILFMLVTIEALVIVWQVKK